jgi:rod shape-determining protein MreD
MGKFLSLPILALAAALQVTLVPQVSIQGGRPDLIFLIVMAWSLNANLEDGVLWAFIGGICKDLLSAAPLGTSVIGLVIWIFAVQRIREQLYSVGLFTLIWVTLIGTVIQQVTVITILLVAGFGPATGSISTLLDEVSYFVLPSIVYNLVMMLPVYWTIRRIQRRVGGDTRLTFGHQ